jgi:hypothetical protein
MATSSSCEEDLPFPADFRKALVHFSFLGFLFILKFLWHFDLQNLKSLASLQPTIALACRTLI